MSSCLNAASAISTVIYDYGVKITSPMAGVWRLQSIADDEHGTLQMLAALTGKQPEGLNVERQLTRVKDDIIAEDGTVIRFASEGITFFTDQEAVLRTFRPTVCENQISLEIELHADEALWGTGERFNGVNQRGKQVNIWAEDQWCSKEGNSYLPIPFILSSRNYAVLLNRFEASQFDLGCMSPDKCRLTQFDAPLDVYFIFAKQPVDIYAKLIKLWGNPVVPPEWGWGTLISRHLNSGEFSTSAGIRKMAEQMAKHDLPWDTVIIEGWDTFNPETYHELMKVTAELSADNKKVMVYEACGRLPEKYWQAQQALPEYFIQDSDGNCEINEAPHFNPQDAPQRRHSRFLDISNPTAVSWWKNIVWQKLVKAGISGAKIDFCEQIPEDSNITLHSKESVKGLHHRYPVQYNIMMCRLFNDCTGSGGLCWSRGGSTGAHLYPFVWSGDQLREFHFLQAVLTAILSSGISGIPFMGHDLGGYLPAKNSDNEAEVFTRGVEFSCFTATMSTHGMVTRPYDFPSPYIDIYRFYSKIRYLLRPYIEEQAAICARTGLPLVRHLFLHYPEDTDFHNCEDQYMFGEDLLVAPVLDNSCSRTVILPPGEWHGLFDDKPYQGKTTLQKYLVPLSIVPVFITAEPKSKVLKKIIAEIRQLSMPGD